MPQSAITHRVDVRRYAAQKRAGLAAHKTDVFSRGRTARLFRALVRSPLPMFRIACGTEWFAISCFAVGLANIQTLIERWQGSKWVQAKNPNPAGATFAALHAVFCLSPAVCWAVGTFAKTGRDSSLAEHWNGSRWSIVWTP